MPAKIAPSLLLALFCLAIWAQEASEIYLFDLAEDDGVITLSNPVNISARQGYDNQPCFSEDGTYLLFSSERDGQYDIARYDLKDAFRVWITDTRANEFSPAPYPGKKNNFTCVRFEEEGTHLLYKYYYKNRAPEILIPNLNVGYYLWFHPKIVINLVIGDVETLQVSNFRYKIKYPIRSNIGRSINRIPVAMELGKELVSIIDLNHEEPEIYAIDPITSETAYLADALEGSQDLTWTVQGTMLMGKQDAIYKLNPKSDSQWTKVRIESDLPVAGITRLAVSPDGTKIAVVVSE